MLVSFEVNSTGDIPGSLQKTIGVLKIYFSKIVAFRYSLIVYNIVLFIEEYDNDK